MKAREERRRKTVLRFAKKRAELKEIIRSPKSSDEERELAQIKLQKLPRDANPIRMQRRCAITGRPHAVYRKFGLGRNKLRELAMKGDIPGLVKSSWQGLFMSMQDPIADLFSRINNAQSRRKSSVVVPSSKKKISLLSLLKDKGYIDSYDVSDSSKPEIEIKLKYFEGAPVIKELKRISKPGLRQYSSNTQLPEVNGGLGIAIISTNQGLMTDAEAKEAGLGGELICSVF